MPVIVNKQLELDKTIQYRLSIQADLNGFSFSIVNDTLNRCHFLYQSDFSYIEDPDTYNVAIYKMIKSFPLLSKKFASTDVLINTHKFTSIPLSNFKSEDAGLILGQLHFLEELDEVDIIIDESQEMALLFAVNSTLLNTIKTIQPEFKVAPSIYPFMKNTRFFPDPNKIFIQYHKGHVHIVLVQGSKVVFCNSFPAVQFNTALYYLMLAVKQSGAKQESFSVFLSGNMREEDVSGLTKYFPRVGFFRHPSILLGNSELEMKYASMMFPL
ncbi:MAG: DUF3822 family protein [Bacteroidales bacterium]|jgi:hypothetical protein|nr:DUF3822 family protein [Bacteroidales bacterium]